MVTIRRGTLYLANLGTRVGIESGKVRPVLVVQNDLLNEVAHPSTWVLPCTTRMTGESLLRVELPRGIAGNQGRGVRSQGPSCVECSAKTKRKAPGRAGPPTG